MSPALRMALQYALLFGASGVSLPFAGLWFRAQGLSGGQIGVILAAPMLARVATGPLLAVWADGFRSRRTAIGLLGLVMVVGYGGVLLTEDVWLWGLLWFLGATAAAALIPLTDVLTLRLAAKAGFSFALPRGCGSLAFVTANVGMGALLLTAPPDVVIWWITACGLLLALAGSLVLPATPVDESGRVAGRWSRFRGLARLLAHRRFMLSIIAVGFVQASHAFQYGFSTLLWRAQGISEAMTGRLWAFGVVVEIALMWLFEPWRRRRNIGPWAMLAAGSTAAVARWALMASAPPLWVLWPLQALHALTFAATFLAGVQIVERMIAPDRQTAAQTLSSAFSAGLLIGLATLLSGVLYDRFGAGGYWAMAAMAALGLALTLWLGRCGTSDGEAAR